MKNQNKKVNSINTNRPSRRRAARTEKIIARYAARLEQLECYHAGLKIPRAEDHTCSESLRVAAACLRASEIAIRFGRGLNLPGMSL